MEPYDVPPPDNSEHGGERPDRTLRPAGDPQVRWSPAPAETPAEPRKSLLPWLLFIATCLSTFFVGMQLGDGTMPDPADLVNSALRNGFAYMGAVMLILGCHEMGHYLQALRYGVPVSPPYFIPMPFSPLGTMGAVIVQRRQPPDRKALFDIAVSGPLAGLVITLPLLYFGLQQAKIMAIPPNHNGLSFGDPLLMQWMSHAIHGPLPAGHDLILNPMLFAAWVGILITALNLIPIGQLDGGHILYTLIGRRAGLVAVSLLLGATGYMVVSMGYQQIVYGKMVIPPYFILCLLLLLMGPVHPPTRNDNVPLGWPRVMIGWLTLGFIILGFTPDPIKLGG